MVYHSRGKRRGRKEEKLDSVTEGKREEEQMV